MENPIRRTWLMRPALRRKIIDRYRQRQHELRQCFRAFGAEPLFIAENYTTQSINRYLQQRTA
jgi:DNA-directed RNA polymerase specialized sigma24 family protein